MMKVFNKGIRTFLLISSENAMDKMRITPGKFFEIPAEFQGDPTLHMALKAGELERYDTISQADAIEKAAKATPEGAVESAPDLAKEIGKKPSRTKK